MFLFKSENIVIRRNLFKPLTFSRISSQFGVLKPHLSQFIFCGFPVSLTNNTCMVEDKVNGFRIDLTPLSQFGVQTTSFNGFEYEVAVCRPLPEGCGNEAMDAAVCRRNSTDKRQPMPLGTATANLIYNGGLVTVLYHDNNESSSIAFHCDFDAGIGRPQVLAVQPGMTVFTWATAFACPTTNANYQSCIVQSQELGGHLYDLSRLTRVRPDRDWDLEFVDPKTPDVRLRFYVSLCRPLRRPPAGCDPLASVCIETIYSNGTKSVADAGHAVDPPKFERGQLMLNYSNGATCVRRGVPSAMRTVIHFHCDGAGDEANGEYLQYIGDFLKLFVSYVFSTSRSPELRVE